MEMLETLRRGYEAFSRGDMSAVAGLATRDVEWGTTGAFPGIDGLYRGPEVIQQWADAIHSDWGDVEVSLDEVLHDGGDVVVVVERLRGRDRARGDEVEMRIYAAYWFEDGKVRRRAASTSREVALEAAGLSE
jgi:ketosteroid isomerase-like protein